ncbi:MAG: hypothetical protein HIU84_00345 [Acidobacteria bacterium]|nr:hypothetical protein [Acidobacteriota bacterium]
MRRYIPHMLLLVLTVLAGSFAVLSWNQAHESSVSIYDCSTTSSVAPSSMVLTCADANTLVKNLRWSGWGEPTATATGLGSWNDCTPNCASGKWKSAPVTISAYRIRHGHYTRVNGTNQHLFGGGPIDMVSYPPAG